MCDSKSNGDMLLKKVEAETSSSLTWNSSCRRSLCSSSKLTQASPVDHDSATCANLSNDSARSVPKDPTHEESKDSTVASLWKEFTQKTGLSKEKFDQLYSDAPVYHIRLEGDGEEHKRSGEKCILCDKDLSCLPNGVDRANDEQKYRVKFIPQCLAAVDILPCGHAIHTDCSKYAMSEESNVPICISCLSMP